MRNAYRNLFIQSLHTGHQTVETIKIKDCELIKSCTCIKSDSITAVSGLFKKCSAHHLVVLEHNTPVGIISASDIVIKVISENKDLSKTRVEDVMSTPAFVLRDDLSVQSGLMSMVKKGFNFCPVIDIDKKYVGIITLQILISESQKA
jgi:CBS domain-containing protein